ncbi:hypothetical protein ACFWMX_00875 [Streptomyces sp. NPDC058378]|uniref:hypothetical protein n=1 Tax=Streptomyces sp. NPDC058378 TaxID=3346469 RepID=UPI003653DEEA
MRGEDAVEIVKVSLALAFPTATVEGIARAAETVVRWGAEDAAEYLDEPLTQRMLLDLLQVAGLSESDYTPADPHWPNADLPPANYRTWSRTELMDDEITYLPRPPDEPPPRGPTPRPGPGAAG